MSEREGRLVMALIAMLQVRDYPCTCDDERLLDLPCPRHSEAEPAARKLADDALASLERTAPLIPRADEAADARIEALMAAQPKRGTSAPLIPHSRAEEAVEREREACAKVADEYHCADNWCGEKISELIRARKAEASRG